MLNQIEKNKILNSIKNNTIHKFLKTEIVSKKCNINKCCDILEFLINEIEKKLTKKRKKTTKTISNLLYSLYVISASILSANNKILIDKESYDKILKFKKLYEENIESIDTNDINVINNIHKIFKKVNLLEMKEEDIIEEKIDNIKSETSNEEKAILKDNLKEAKRKIKELNKTIKDLKLELEKCVDEETINSYKKEIINLNNKIKDLNETISNLSSKNQSIESINENLKKQITDITNSLTNRNQALENEISTYKEKANKYDKEKIQKEYEKELDNLILTYIADEDLTIEELLVGLKFKFPNVSKNNILESLKRLQSTYILTKDNILNNEFTYKLGKKRNKFYTVKNDTDTLDMIIISDLHIDNSIDLRLNNLNYIYDYAAKNNIKTIVNLGDTIDGRIYNDKSTLENLKYYDELVNKTIEKLPKDENIINLLLGGNHDRSLLDLGIDVTDRIDKNRLDYINLGNDHAMLKFNDTNVGLHHFNRRYDDNFINITNPNDFELFKTLNDYYTYRGIDKKNTFIDLLGHFHVSKISIPNNYITIPSLNFDHIQNGAYRIKLFFDSKGNIKNSILIPLIVDNKVIESTSITYKK